MTRIHLVVRGLLGCVALVATALCLDARAAAELLVATQAEPRAYGYFVGDVVERRIDIDVPAPLQLDPESLPRAGRQGQALEVRAVRWQRRGFIGTRYVLTLQYQVFFAPTEVRVFEMPPVKLRFTGGPRVQELRVDAWPVTVAPLAPPEPSPRTGLGELRPDAPPPRIDTRFIEWRLIGYAVIALALLAYLAHVYVALPWWSRRALPFAQAYRELRGRAATASADEARAAMQRVHQALNRSAGQVLFAHGVAGYVAAQPRFGPLQDELRVFFERSRGAFFGEGEADAAGTDLRWLIELCRRGRDLERGSA